MDDPDDFDPDDPDPDDPDPDDPDPDVPDCPHDGQATKRVSSTAKQ